jgi:quinol monooxygenase YgiN
VNDGAGLERSRTSTVSLLPAFVAQPHRRAELQVALGHLAAASTGDPGCLVYRVFQDADSMDRFVIVEEWADQGALDAHNKKQHVVRFFEVSRHLLVAPVTVTRLVPAT